MLLHRNEAIIKIYTTEIFSQVDLITSSFIDFHLVSLSSSKEQQSTLSEV